ncbi:ABC transporter ATP-binding protein [Limnochorda pilosa]|uniref:Peptide ABC transporter ATPase n=1 Tax=Limnochorda pilosa TaxID=1555112 RepID=A0A0K2SI46_LIMPI|nr:dipeptide/oligopeptide/nickel ABC transporter ATP-binding protein [Limnochorda pilosa]BAS26801.1 peptide ABC transporter ATPase [Limnochorda pilosa]
MPHADDSVLIETQHLTRTFGQGAQQVRAVDDVSLRLHRGEIASVVGESGSGKSTLARLMLRLLQPSAGRILFEGADVTRQSRLPELRRYWQRVQAVFQDPSASFNQFLTVRRLLERGLGLEGSRLDSKERDARVRWALERVALNPGEMLAKLSHEMSGGERQRVMIARALVVRPLLLLADEPTTMVDASSRASILNVLLDLRDEFGMAILFITHDVSLATYVSDTLFVMHDGRLVESGGVERITASPEHAYTRQLFADAFTMSERG